MLQRVQFRFTVIADYFIGKTTLTEHLIKIIHDNRRGILNR